MSSEVLDKMVQLVTAAFGLVAALAWNEAIQGLFTLIFGEAGDLAPSSYTRSSLRSSWCSLR